VFLGKTPPGGCPPVNCPPEVLPSFFNPPENRNWMEMAFELAFVPLVPGGGETGVVPLAFPPKMAFQRNLPNAAPRNPSEPLKRGRQPFVYVFSKNPSCPVFFSLNRKPWELSPSARITKPLFPVLPVPVNGRRNITVVSQLDARKE